MVETITGSQGNDTLSGGKGNDAGFDQSGAKIGDPSGGPATPGALTTPGRGVPEDQRRTELRGTDIPDTTKVGGGMIEGESEGARRAREMRDVQVHDAQSKQLSDMKASLTWALAEIDRLSTKHYEVTYPQGLAHHHGGNKANFDDSSEQFYRAKAVLAGRDPDRRK